LHFSSPPFGDRQSPTVSMSKASAKIPYPQKGKKGTLYLCTSQKDLGQFKLVSPSLDSFTPKGSWG
jgi:hypothetical protein